MSESQSLPLNSISCASVGVLAGARIFSNRTVPGLPLSGYYDLDVEIVFHSQSDLAAMLSERGEAARRETVPLPYATGLKGLIAKDGRWAVIEETPHGFLDRALWVRRVLPFLAALQGQVTLHASAVASTTGVHAFVGASGAGKSTLAGCLARFGWRPISDDLLPCRRREGGVSVPIGGDQTLPLRAIYFLSRQDGLECVRRTHLNGVDCLKRLLAHGFGEIALKKAWAAQFELYGSIAHAITAYDLASPDALPRLDQSVLEVSAMIADPTFQTFPRLGSD